MNGGSYISRIMLVWASSDIMSIDESETANIQRMLHQPFELASLESEYTISGAAEEVYAPEQYKSITNIEELDNYCDEEIIKYALEYPTLMYTPYSEEELRSVTDRRSYVGDGFCREFVLPDGTVVGYTGMLYSVNNEYLIFEEDFVGYNDECPADETFRSSFVRVE